MDPRYAPALLDLGTVYLQKGDNGAAVAQFAKAKAEGGENGTVLSRLAQACLLSGKREDGLKILDRLRKRPAPLIVSSWDISFVYAAFG
jgi:Flp pilus assembly protein TadD